MCDKFEVLGTDIDKCGSHIIVEEHRSCNANFLYWKFFKTMKTCRDRFAILEAFYNAVAKCRLYSSGESVCEVTRLQSFQTWETVNFRGAFKIRKGPERSGGRHQKVTVEVRH